MQAFLGAKKFSKYLDSSTPTLTKPAPLADDANDNVVKVHEKATETYWEWSQVNTEAKHYILSTIPDRLVIKMISCTSIKELWDAICVEHESKTKVS